MRKDITSKLKEEHRLILRMLDLLERNARHAASGGAVDCRFFLAAVDFVRNFADRFHHAKEEDILFEALVDNGMPRENSPVAVMLIEHEQGRAFVRGMEEAARRALDGIPGQEEAIAENALGYVGLLRDHIKKEDEILYPLAERVMPDERRERIEKGYAAAESGKGGEETEKRYRNMVERYELKTGD